MSATPPRHSHARPPVRPPGGLQARCLRDWHPDSNATEQDWLADLYDQGWVPDHYYGGGPAIVSIGDNPPVHRWAMVAAPPDEEDQPALNW